MSVALMGFFVNCQLAVYTFVCLFSSFAEVSAPHPPLIRTAGSSPLDEMMDDPWDAVLCHNKMSQPDSASSIRPQLRPLCFPPTHRNPPSRQLFGQPAADTSNLATALSWDVGEQNKGRFGLAQFSTVIAASTRISPL